MLTDFFLLVIERVRLSLYTSTYCLFYEYFIHLNEISYETNLISIITARFKSIVSKYWKIFKKIAKCLPIFPLLSRVIMTKRMHWYRWYYNSVISFINQFADNRSVYQITAYSNHCKFRMVYMIDMSTFPISFLQFSFCYKQLIHFSYKTKPHTYTHNLAQ